MLNRERDVDSWSLFFCDMNQLRDLVTNSVRGLQEHQRIGHFKNCQEISRKNNLVKNLKKFRYDYIIS